MMKAKNRTPIFTLLFCKDNIVKKRQLRFDIAKAALLRCKIIIKIYLSENKEVTLFVQLNW